MRSQIPRIMFAVAGSLLPVSILLVFLMDGPLWAGMVAWFVVAAVLVLLGLAIGRTRR
ncbi:hypothetical protein GCM10023176_34350 [Micromonospora coerulea]|uniref:DUF4175 domain-containing protein n=1 Tax=Micromonospora coerulea TaxID=47856 RepID=A0ABP8SPT6_9ACTN